MRFTTQTTRLLKPLQQLIGVVQKRQTMAVLANFLIKTEENQIRITASDTEIEMVSVCHIDIDEPGETTIPAKKLVDICKVLPEDSEINVTVREDNTAIIKAGRSRYTLGTLPAQDFPVLEDINAIQRVVFPQSKLREIIDKTSFSMAQQDVRYYLNGMMLEISPGMLRGVTADGHRLSYAEQTVDINVDETYQIIVPRKGIQELRRLVEHTEDAVELAFSANHLQITLPDLTFTSKLIDGKFPDYNRVIPTEGDNVFWIQCTELRDALMRASVLCDDKLRGIRVALNQDSILLQSQNPEHEHAEVQVDTVFKGQAMEIGLNVNYLLDVLSVSSSESIQGILKDSNSSCLLQFPDLPHCRYVIMPMRL